MCWPRAQAAKPRSVDHGYPSVFPKIWPGDAHSIRADAVVVQGIADPRHDAIGFQALLAKDLFLDRTLTLAGGVPRYGDVRAVWALAT